MRQLSFLAQKNMGPEGKYFGSDGLTDAQGINLPVSEERYQENHEHLHHLGICDCTRVSEFKISSRSAEEPRKSFSASLGGTSRDSLRTAPLH